MENINLNCQCAGDYRCLISKSDSVKLLNSFLKLSEMFNMEVLKETVELILNNTT